MKLQRTFICIAGVFFAVGFGASQAAAQPGICDFQLEINKLHAGGNFVNAGPNKTANVTARARIQRGTAPCGTTIAVTLEIEALDGPVSLHLQEAGPITLKVGSPGCPGEGGAGRAQCSR